jgi:hypothetical protein
MVNYSPRRFVPAFPEKPEKCATSLPYLSEWLRSAGDRSRQFSRATSSPVTSTPGTRATRRLGSAAPTCSERRDTQSRDIVHLCLDRLVRRPDRNRRSALEESTARDNPGYSSTDISDAVTVVLAGSGGGALVLVLLALLSLQLLRARKNAGRVMTAIVGVVSIAAGLGFMSLVDGAADIGAGVLRWGPILYCALVAGAAIAPFAPGVSTWLRGRR